MTFAGNFSADKSRQRAIYSERDGASLRFGLKRRFVNPETFFFVQRKLRFHRPGQCFGGLFACVARMYVAISI